MDDSPGRDRSHSAFGAGPRAPLQRVLTIAGMLATLTAVGTLGFRFVDPEASWLDCLYMAVITLTTVGYREVIEVRGSAGGKLFVVLYLVGGLSVFTYSAFQLGQLIVGAEMRQLWERRRMQQSVGKLRNHYIVCGQGRMGTVICESLAQHRRPFVVIDIDERGLQEVCESRNWLYVVGDATDDEVLKKAGIQRARSLASVLPTDADNIYVVLSARLLAGGLQIIARASEEKAVEKLQRAGATRVVSPFSSGAQKMARFMLTPSIEDFLEIADRRGTDLELADVQISEESPYAGKRLQETDLRERGVMVIGIRKASGERLMPPSGTATIEPGDCLFAFGSSEAVNQMIGETDQVA